MSGGRVRRALGLLEELPRRGSGPNPDPDPNPDRGLSPVVGKTLELGVGVLFVALLSATFFGGIVPEYRTAVGAELGERTTVAAAERVEAAVPPNGDASFVDVERSVAVRLPPTVRGDPYHIVAEGSNGSALRLVHPDRSIGGRVRLAVPDGASVSGAWTSSSPSRLLVSAADGTLSLRLVDVETDTVGRTSVNDSSVRAGERP